MLTGQRKKEKKTKKKTNGSVYRVAAQLKILDHVKLRKIYQDSCLCCNFQHVVSNKDFKSLLLENL